MAETWTVLRILEWTADYFRSQGIESARLDAELLLADVLDLDRVGLYLDYDRPLVRDELDAYRGLVRRRSQHEPVAYIRGKTEFWSLPFRVTRDVLVPRPDTEILVEEALSRMGDRPCRVLDIGLGSGAIAVALAHEKNNAAIAGIDVSPAAVAVATENARINGVAERTEFCVGRLEELAGGPYDMIVSNPPYVPRGDLDGLIPDVRDFEPLLALDGGADGLDAYRAIAGRAPDRLVRDGWLLVEIGIGQDRDVVRMFSEAGFSQITVRNDYAGIPRVVAGKKK